MKVLFKDENLIACIKPVGVDSEKQMPQIIAEQEKKQVYTVHRLDVNVEGVMVYAFNKNTAAYLSNCIRQGSMVKEYVACVHGTPDECGVLEDLLFKDSKKNKVFVVDKMRKGVKAAKLEYKRLSASDTSIVQIRLHTGRSHQIRVQFASRGYPLVGDHKYGSKAEQKTPMLYSCRITFPYKEKTVSFESFPHWMNT
ncbi:MAG: RNA pseudouridine synthase [Clostridia bacterium]|nr:RNA pseudouridine synthase [Clostridia bacterium]